MEDSGRSGASSFPDASIIMNEPVGSTVKTPCGNIRRCVRLQPIERAFLVIALVDIIGVTIFTITSLVTEAQSAESGSSNEDFTYAIIVIINIVFCLGYLLSGLFREKLYDVAMLVASLAFVTIYCILDVIAKSTTPGGEVTPIKWVRLVLVCVGSLVSIPLAILVMKSFGFFAFRVVGTSDELQKLYQRLSFFNSVIIIDVQFAINLVVLVLWKGAHVDYREKITLGIGLPAILIWAVLGIIIARYEKKIAMIAFEVVGLAAFGYVGWKSSIIDKHDCFLHPTTAVPLSSTPLSSTPLRTTPLSFMALSSTIPASTTSYLLENTTFYCFPTYKLLLASALVVALFIISHLLVLITGLFLLKGFGKGLKQKLLEEDRNLLEHVIEEDNSNS